MQDTSLHIIQLKQQTRLGKDIPNATTDAKNQLDAAYSNIQSSAGSILGVFNQVSEALLDLQDVQTSAATGINKLAGNVQVLNKAFADNVEQIIKIFQRNNELQKTYGLTEKAAQDYGFQLDTLSIELNYGREETEKYVKQLGGLTAGFIAAEGQGGYLNESLIKQQRYLTDIVGVSEEAAEAIMEMNAGIASRGVAKDAKVTADMLEKQLVQRANEAKAIEKLTGLKGVQRTIDAEIAAAGSETALQYSRYPKQLSIAIMKSKALGLSMQQLAKTGDELLNIESSVGNELEYQLLSGKRLVDTQGNSLTNMYRQATLQGDMNKQADIMKKIMDTQGDVLENNMMARKQLAATLGVEESTMAKMVQKRKLLKSMGAEKLFDLTGEALQKELKNLGASRDDIAEIMEQDDTRTTQDRMAESLRNIETKGILAHFATKTDGKITGYNKDTYNTMYNKSIETINTSLGSFKTAMGATEDGLALTSKSVFKFNENLAPAIGSFSLLNQSITPVTTQLNALASAIPVIGTKFSAAMTLLNNKITGLTGTTLANMTMGTHGIPTQQTPQIPDGIMMNDGFVTFNPRDKFTRVNDGMTVAGTNVGGIDRFAAQMEKRDSRFEQTMTRLLSNMATQMKQAVEAATLKVQIDKTFSTNTMNRGRYA